MKKISLLITILVFTMTCWGQSLFFENLNNSTWKSEPYYNDSTIRTSKEIRLGKIKSSTDSLKVNVTIWMFKNGSLTIKYYDGYSKKDSLVAIYKYEPYPDRGVLKIILNDNKTLEFEAGIISTGSYASLKRKANFSMGQNPPARRTDSVYWRIENKTKSSFWGNSTYISASANFARNKEFDFNIGRTYGVASYSERGLGYYSISSWGLGYGLTNTLNETKQTAKIFYEYNFFPFIIIGNFGLRGEYIYNITDKQNYLRPSIGCTFVYVDVSYNYSFLLNGNKSDNLYGHGLSVRLKYFLTKRNWERNVFERQRRV
jgi:hypothetical protein